MTVPHHKTKWVASLEAFCFLCGEEMPNAEPPPDGQRVYNHQQKLIGVLFRQCNEHVNPAPEVIDE